MFNDKKPLNKPLFPLYLGGISSVGCYLLLSMAQAVEPAGININYYLDKLKVERKENIIQKEIRQFSSFPHLDKAHRLADANKQAEAIVEFERYLKIDPADINARIAYSVFMYNSKRFTEANTQLDIILSSAPDLVPARLYRGLTRQALKNIAGASEDFEAVAAAADVQPNDRYFALNTSIDLNIEAGHTEKAQALMQQLSKINPSFNSFYREGVLLEKQGRAGDAATAYQSAFNLTQDPAEKHKALSAIAEAATKSQQWDKAKQNYAQILQLQPNDPQATRGMAYALYNQKDLNSAITWINKLLAQKNSPQDREFLANLLNESQQYPSACAEYSTLSTQFKESNDRKRILTALGYCYQHLNQDKAAAGAFKQATISGDWRNFKTFQLLAKLPPQSQTHFNLSNLLQAKHNDQEICTEYASMLPNLNHSSERADVLMALGNCYKSHDLNDNAIDAYTQAADISNDARSLQALGMTQEAKGDKQAAIATYQRLSSINPTAQVHLKLANLYKATHDDKNALAHYDSAIKLAPPSKQASVLSQMGIISYGLGQYTQAERYLKQAEAIKPNDSALLYSLAETANKTGELDNALRYLKKAVELKPTVHGLRSLADVQIKQDNWTDAQQTYQQLLRLKKLSAADRRKTLESLAFVNASLGQDGDQIEILSESIKAGNNTTNNHKNLGYHLSKAKRYEEALAQFNLSLNAHNDPETRVAMAQVYRHLNKPTEAIAQLEQAQLSDTPVTPKFKTNLLNELGYLYTDQANYPKAANVWQQSLAIAPNPVIALSYARILRQTKQLASAKTVLQQLDRESLPDNTIKAQYWDELAAVFDAEQSVVHAIDAQKRAINLQQTAARHYQLALLYQKANQPDAAVSAFQQASKQEPSNTIFTETLAYAYVNTNQPEKANHLFTQVVAKNPKRSDLQKELGYINEHVPDNQKASDWFKQAIDTTEKYPDPNQTPEDRHTENYRLRREVEKLNHFVDVTAYQSLRLPDSKHDNRSTTQGGVLGGVIPSQGGVQLSLQPPVIGLRDERALQVFTRFLWNAPSGSLSIDPDSIQGGVGVRYKPLQKHDLYVGAERLFKIGPKSNNDWLFRASYGWNDGNGLKPGMSSWNYTTLFTDIGYFTNQAALAFYGEVRQGYTFNLYDRFLITPHLVLDGKTQTNDIYNTAYLEGGAGVSFKFLFNESHYMANRSSFELLAQYKMGIENVDGGFMMTGIFGY